MKQLILRVFDTLGHRFFIFCFTDFFFNKLRSEDEIKIKTRGPMVL